jgi:hypothetical protein
MSFSWERFSDLTRLRSLFVMGPLALSSFFRISASMAGSSKLTSAPVGQSASFFFGFAAAGAALGVGAGVGVGVGVGAAVGEGAAEGARLS